MGVNVNLVKTSAVRNVTLRPSPPQTSAPQIIVIPGNVLNVKTTTSSSTATAPTARVVGIKRPAPSVMEPATKQQQQQPPRKRANLDHMSPDEKLMRRKLKNRVAAQNARDKKRVKMDDMERRIQILEKQNATLIQQNRDLMEMNQRLLRENQVLNSSNSSINNDNDSSSSILLPLPSPPASPCDDSSHAADAAANAEVVPETTTTTAPALVESRQPSSQEKVVVPAEHHERLCLPQKDPLLSTRLGSAGELGAKLSSSQRSSIVRSSCAEQQQELPIQTQKNMAAALCLLWTCLSSQPSSNSLSQSKSKPRPYLNLPPKKRRRPLT